LIARGLDNGAIAAALSKSEKTVRNQVTSIFAKLRVNSRAQAVALARDAGIGDAP
jgi:DNA-binding NarL/FixJ family response regulator